MCLFTPIHVYRNTSVYLGRLLSTSRFCLSLPPCVKKVVQQVLLTSLVFGFWFFFLNALAKDFIAYYPGMRPCFDLNFPVFCCLVVCGRLNGSSYRTTGKQNTFYHCPHPQREKKAQEVPTDLGSTGQVASLCCLGEVMKSYS